MPSGNTYVISVPSIPGFVISYFVVTDAEDVCQEVFLKMLLHDISFDDAEHEKAWIIRTTINACKDIVRKRAVRNLISIEDVSLPDKAEAEDNLVDKTKKDHVKHYKCYR